MNPNSYLLQAENTMLEIAVSKILSLNALTEKAGLLLTHADASELVQTQRTSLRNNHRFEFGSDTIYKLAFAFSNSPYLTQSNYAETLHDLIELFYHFKGETCEALDDDTLIALMKEYFDNICEGSLELLAMKDLETMAQNLREGKADFKSVREAHNWYEWEEWNE